MGKGKGRGKKQREREQTNESGIKSLQSMLKSIWQMKIDKIDKRRACVQSEP